MCVCVCMCGHSLRLINYSHLELLKVNLHYIVSLLTQFHFSAVPSTHTSHTHTVTNLRVINTTTNSVTITWNQPPHNYRVFLHGEATDNIPQSRVIQLVNVTGQTTHIVEGLNSFRKYSIGVYLEFNLGQRSNATVTFQTQGRGENADRTVPMCLCACVHVSWVRTDVIKS